MDKALSRAISATDSRLKWEFARDRTDIQIADWQPRPMLIMFIIVALLDYAQTAVRGELFSSPYYVPFTLHYIVLAGLAAYLQSDKVYRITAWYFLVSFFSWALIVRRFLA